MRTLHIKIMGEGQPQESENSFKNDKIYSHSLLKK
jgi:hypothetical protein